MALTISLPVAGLTLAFYVAYRLGEDYLLVPRIMGRTVQVPAAATVVAVLIGGALLGLVGALVAIPSRGRDPAAAARSDVPPDGPDLTESCGSGQRKAEAGQQALKYRVRKLSAPHPGAQHSRLA